MELRQLSYFIKLAETLNFSTAARELFITQSTLSHQILQLEREFDQALFLRNSHEVSLTEAGEQLLPLAKATVRSADHCRSRLEELKNLPSLEALLLDGVDLSDTLCDQVLELSSLKLLCCKPTIFKGLKAE